MSKKRTLLITIAVVFTGLVFTVTARMVLNGDQPEVVRVLSVNDFASTDYGIRLSLPQSLPQNDLLETDQKNKVFLRINQSSVPKFSITARAENGLRKPSQATKQSVLALISDGALRTLPGSYEEYSLISEKRLVVNSIEMQDIIFTYSTGAQGVTQHLVLIVTDSDTAVYLTFQAISSEFDTLNALYFEPIVQSIRL